MAAIHENIRTLIGTAQTQMSSARNAVKGLIASGFQCSRGVKLYSSFATSEKYMKKIQTALINAYDAAIVMTNNDGKSDTVKRSTGIVNLSYSLPSAQREKAVISLDYSEIETQLSALKTSKNNLNEALSRCKTIISTVNAATYTDSSNKSNAAALTAGVLAGVGAVAVVKAADLAAEAAKKKKFETAQETVLSNLKTAKKNLTSLDESLGVLYDEIAATRDAFKKADTIMETEIKVVSALSTYKSYISGSYTGKQLKAEKTTLEALQKEYESVNGETSDAIDEAIVQLKELLPPNLVDDFSTIKSKFEEKWGEGILDQHSSHYNYCKNKCCKGVAYAFAVYLVTETMYKPTDFIGSDANASYPSDVTGVGVDLTKKYVKGEAKGASVSKEALTDIYNQLKNGVPVLLHYQSANSSGHWVTVVGISEDANVNDLSLSDLIIFNPTGGVTSKLDGSSIWDVYYNTLTISTKS